MQLPKRHYVSGDRYRFGFQGMERDDEVKGGGMSYTTEFRQIDPRIIRWLSIDPEEDASQSRYNSMDNNPICNIDPLGDKIRIVGAKSHGQYGKPTLEYRLKARGIILLARTIGPKEVRQKIKDLQKDSRTHFLVETDYDPETGGTVDNFEPREDGVTMRHDLEKGETVTLQSRVPFGPRMGQITFDSYEGTGQGTIAESSVPLDMSQYDKDVDFDGNRIIPNFGRGVMHELRHMWDWAFGHNTAKTEPNGLQTNEKRATQFENLFVDRMNKIGLWRNQKRRATYSGLPIN